MKAIDETRFAAFAVAYRNGLGSAVAARPADYPWAMWPQDVDRVAAKMMQAIREGTYNKSGDGFRRTYKSLGINHTYRDINAYLRGE